MSLFYYSHAFSALDVFVDTCRQHQQADVEYHEILGGSFPLEIPNSCEFSKPLMSAVKSSIIEMIQSTSDDRLMCAQVVGEIQDLYNFHTKDKRSLQTIERCPGVSVYQCCFVDRLTAFLNTMSTVRREIDVRLSICGCGIKSIAGLEDPPLMDENQTEIQQEIASLKKFLGLKSDYIEEQPKQTQVPVELLLADEQEVVEPGEEDTANDSQNMDSVAEDVPMISIPATGIISQMECVSLVPFAPQEEIKLIEEQKNLKSGKRSDSSSLLKKLFRDSNGHKHKHSKRHHC